MSTTLNGAEPAEAESKVAKQQMPRHHQQRWNKTWTEFNRALRSPDPFNPFPWILRLALAGVDYIYHQSRLNAIVDKYQLTKRWTSLIPLLVGGLVGFLWILYACSIRKMIQERWCHGPYCTALSVQDSICVYFGVMVLYNYFKTNLSSPGVALPTKPERRPWTSMDHRGGFYGSRGHPKLDVDAEEFRVSLYGKLEGTQTIATNRIIDPSLKVFPNPDPSYCQKCNILRPPRCHHCRICNRCVLQFDHHCLWVNNCIGYNNYRTFLALLLHIVLASWYSLLVMMVPFYELVRQEQARQAAESPTNDDQEGNYWLVKLFLAYQQNQLFDNVPTNPWAFGRSFCSDDGLHWTIAIKVAYPLLLGIGTILSIFLGFHVKYVIRARTTLEHKIILETQCSSLWEQSLVGARPSRAEPDLWNPFDDGWRNNLYRILGPRPWHLLLPIHVSPPAPFVPNTTNAEKKAR